MWPPPGYVPAPRVSVSPPCYLGPPDLRTVAPCRTLPPLPFPEIAGVFRKRCLETYSYAYAGGGRRTFRSPSAATLVRNGNSPVGATGARRGEENQGEGAISWIARRYSHRSSGGRWGRSSGKLPRSRSGPLRRPRRPPTSSPTSPKVSSTSLSSLPPRSSP